MEPMQHYRDDGPIVETMGSATASLPIPPILATPLGIVFLVIGVLADGRTTGGLTIAGVGIFVLLASAGSVKPPKRRIQWLTPPLLRAAEYGFLAFMGWRVGVGVLPATYGLLAAIAFHHYDVVYRIRHQRIPPPPWLFRIGGGWDGRMLLMLTAALAGVYEGAAVALAVWCGTLFALESVASWVRVARDANRTVAVAAEDDEE